MRSIISKIFLILSLSVILSASFYIEAFAEDDNLFCDSDTIRNFEDMGYDESLVYIKTDDIILSVDTWYDDTIYFDDVNMAFSVNENYMVVGNLGEDGKFYINSYNEVINMYDYDNACILKVSDKIPVKNKSVTYLTNDGIVNDFMRCESDSFVMVNLCSLMLLSTNFFSVCFSNPVVAVVLSVNLAALSMLLIYMVVRRFRGI